MALFCSKVEIQPSHLRSYFLFGCPFRWIGFPGLSLHPEVHWTYGWGHFWWEFTIPFLFLKISKRPVLLP